MNILSILQMIAAAGTALTGLLALVKPDAVYGFTGLLSSGPRGVSEIRAIFGGLFIALGVAPFLLGRDSYRMLGFGYLAIAVARVASIIIDKSYDQSNWISLVIEIIFGLILIIRV